MIFKVPKKFLEVYNAHAQWSNAHAQFQHQNNAFKALRMRITLLLELRMRVINVEKLFQNFGWIEIGQKTEFIPARPGHQNVKKIRKFFLSENHS